MSCGCKSTRVFTSCSSPCQTSCKCTSCCEKKTCVETNCGQVCTALVVDNAWNIPACDAEAILSVPGLTTVLIGSYISNPTYGTFKVTGFSSVTEQLTVLNECLSGNEVPGTVVPAGTEFVFGTPPTLTEYTDWTPLVSASGSMTVSALVINQAEYFDIGTTTFFNLSIGFTLGGVTSTTVIITLPNTPIGDNASFNKICAASHNGAPVTNGGRWRALSSGVIQVTPAAGGNWTLGASASIDIQGRYEI